VTGFSDRFRQVVDRRFGREPLTPGRAISLWEDFVDSCEEGYDYGLVEYGNDLLVRDLLQRALDDEEILRMPERDWFAAEVIRIDERFRRAAVVEIPRGDAGVAWWRTKMPGRAGPEFCQDVLAEYGIRLEVIE
jgi:hypothetical protein